MSSILLERHTAPAALAAAGTNQHIGPAASSKQKKKKINRMPVLIWSARLRSFVCERAHARSCVRLCQVE